VNAAVVLQALPESLLHAADCEKPLLHTDIEPKRPVPRR
jgi:hypothetical protein